MLSPAWWKVKNGKTFARCVLCGLEKWIKDGDGGACPTCAAKR